MRCENIHNLNTLESCLIIKYTVFHPIDLKFSDIFTELMNLKMSFVKLLFMREKSLPESITDKSGKANRRPGPPRYCVVQTCRLFLHEFQMRILIFSLIEINTWIGLIVENQFFLLNFRYIIE